MANFNYQIGGVDIDNAYVKHSEYLAIPPQYRKNGVYEWGGGLWAWGYNYFGQLGQGNVISYSSPVQVGSLTTWSKIACAYNNTLATKTDGTLWACGYNNYGQLGQGNITNYSSPVQVGSLTTWSLVAGGQYHTLATKTDGTLWAWGYNNYGQLGTGDSYINYSSPVQVGSLTTWSKIAGGRYHTLATQQY